MKNKMALKSIMTLVTILGLSACASQRHDLHDAGVKSEMGVEMAFKRDLPSNHISTHVDYGIIQAAGFVDNETQLHKVANIMSSHANQYKVINNVKVLQVHDNTKDEKHLAKAVNKQLNAKRFPTKDIGVQVRNGHVILSGFINRHVDINDLTNSVATLPGVKTVDNYVLYKQKNYSIA